MSKTKSIRKSILSPKTGKVTLTASQPGAIMLSPDGSTATTTSARIDLRYEAFSSHSGHSPSTANLPRVTEVTSKISAMTFFGGSAIRDFPNMRNWVRTYGAEGRGSYTYNMALGSTAVGDSEWKQHSSAVARRDSGYCSDVAADSDHATSRRWSASSSSSSAKTKSPVYHTTSLQVPIQIPAHKKSFVPTFHSCIASRVYVLWLTVSVTSCGGSSTSKTTLAVPLQIGVEEPETSADDGEGPQAALVRGGHGGGRGRGAPPAPDPLRPRSRVRAACVAGVRGLGGVADGRDDSNPFIPPSPGLAAPKADCQALVRSHLSPQEADGEVWNIGHNHNLYQVAYGHCLFIISARVRAMTWPAKMGDGDVGLLVGQALKQFGNDTRLEASGTAKCRTENPLEGAGPLEAFWMIRNTPFTGPDW
ncbi:hypothetical protein PG993_002423 [Apiospora rasikravindrae]|uniref:Ecp2 effector protein-like domain-containing protein n=1 Tax=Apiospora rasikravindrae TaxID=990691 RepID=A0ABR1TWV3_9PEZI